MKPSKSKINHHIFSVQCICLYGLPLKTDRDSGFTLEFDVMMKFGKKKKLNSAIF